MRHESQISINGAVAQPLLLSLTSLMAMECQKVQCNDISRAGEYRGIFNYRGVPLQELLRPARIKKLDEAFKKPVDLAIVVKNRAGEKSVLSWGEIFTASPATSFSRLAAARCSPAIPTATAATRNRFTLSDSPPPAANGILSQAGHLRRPSGRPLSGRHQRNQRGRVPGSCRRS